MQKKQRRTRPARNGSLLDQVQKTPTRFGSLGFVFTNAISDPVVHIEAKNNLAVQHRNLEPEIEALPDDCIFAGWSADELARWPATFVEFWVPRPGRMQVYGRQVRFFEPQTGSVFAPRNWRAVKAQLPCPALAAKACFSKSAGGR